MIESYLRRFTEPAAPAFYRYPQPPYPTGWFRIADSADLGRGKTLAVRYFGRDLVLFRTESGEARVADAHCPHLGAHVGIGGKVKGDCIECPFHGWRFDREGACVHVPLARKVPARARLSTWPVVERHGVILVHHDPSGAPPAWHMPPLPETNDPSWTPLRPVKRWKIRAHVQEILENGFDNAHFTHLHSQQTEKMRTEAVDVDGPTITHRTWQTYQLFQLAKLRLPEVAGPLDVIGHGLGIIVNRATVHADVELCYTYVFYATPIDETHLELRSTLAMKRLPSRIATEILWRKAASEGSHTIDQDVPIWENKLYRTQPLLSDADGAIMQYRRWARQFYPSPGTHERGSTAEQEIPPAARP